MISYTMSCSDSMTTNTFTQCLVILMTLCMLCKIFVMNGILQVDTVIDLSEQSQNDPVGSSSTAERCVAHTITIIALRPPKWPW